MIKLKKSYIILVILSLIFAKVSGGNLPYGILYIALFVGALSLIYIPIALKKINVFIQKDDDKNMNEIKYYVGCKNSIRILVENESWLPIPYVNLNNKIFEELIKDYKGNFFYLNPYERYWIKEEISFQKRGIYNLDMTNLKITDWFNILTIKKEKKQEEILNIYPKIYDLSNEVLTITDGMESLGSRVVGSKERNQIRDVREYQVGDSIKNIHWKLSAKQSNLYVKNYEKTLGRRLNIIMNMESIKKHNCYNAIDEEFMVDVTSSLVYSFLKQGIKSEINIKNIENFSLKLQKYDDLEVLLEYFLRNDSESKDGFSDFTIEKMKDWNKTSSVVIITLAVDEVLKNTLINLSDLGYSITLIYCEKNLRKNENVIALKDSGIKCKTLKSLMQI